MEAKRQRPLVIGWKEYVDFADWGATHVKVKIDTGARTSALGAQRCILNETNDGVIAELHLALRRRHPEEITVVQTPVLRMVVVRNSSGTHEERPLIETSLRLGRLHKRVSMTVTSRACMIFPVILGRSALAGDFVVDVSRKYLLRP